MKAALPSTGAFAARLVPALASLAGVAVGQIDEVDWTRYCVDGVQLTGNYDTRYLRADPVVGVTYRGEPLPDAGKLFDSYGQTALSWESGEPIEVTLDLGTRRLVLGIVVQGGASAWQFAVSRDGGTWHSVPPERMWPDGNAAGSMAARAQFVRVRAHPVDRKVTIREVYVLGERGVNAGAIGGIYPSRYPPVAGEPGRLRAVVRNTGDRPEEGLRVRFEQTEPEKVTLGETTIARLEPRSATVASIPWTPGDTVPHRLTVWVGSGRFEQGRETTIPVVKRPVYLTGFNPQDNERLIHYNLYTTVAGTESYMARLRGRIALAYVEGPCVRKGEPREFWETTWEPWLKRPDSDGLAIDEFATIAASGKPEPGAHEALGRLRERYPHKLIAPWLIGDMDDPGSRTYRDAELILSELYVNLLNHHTYRHYIDRRLDSMRTWGFLDRVVLVLSSFMGQESTTREQLEREIAYARYRAPEMPGIGVYGAAWSDYSRFTDDLTYRYFIVPVVKIERPRPSAGQPVSVTLSNIGGMDARDVVVEAVGLDGGRLGVARVRLLKAGERKQVEVDVDRPQAVCSTRGMPGGGYTVLNPPKRLEVLPRRQVRGGPLQIYWDLEMEADVSRDRFEFVGEGDLRVHHRVDNDGSWSRPNGALNVSTAPLPAGRYLVRMVNGATGYARTMMDSVEIAAGLGTFFVSAVNGQARSERPRAVKVRPGETFEIAWDFSPKEVEGPAIYLSPPDEPLRAIDRGDEPYTMVRLARLRGLMKTPAAEPMLKGRWTWPTVPKPEDLLENGGWLARRSGPQDPKEDSRLNMAATPGVWRLWIGTEFGPKTWLACAPPKVHGAVPVTPVVTVEVVP